MGKKLTRTRNRSPIISRKRGAQIGEQDRLHLLVVLEELMRRLGGVRSMEMDGHSVVSVQKGEKLPTYLINALKKFGRQEWRRRLDSAIINDLNRDSNKEPLTRDGAFKAVGERHNLSSVAIEKIWLAAPDEPLDDDDGAD